MDSVFIQIVPGYKPATDEKKCSNCAYGSTGNCRLYQMQYSQGFTCDAWQTNQQMGEPHEGAMIALFIDDPQLVEQLDTYRATITDEPRDFNYHITLFYLGNVAEALSIDQYLKILAPVTVANEEYIITTPGRMKTGGLIMFSPNPENDNLIPVCVSVDGAQLFAYRALLASYLNEQAVDYQQNHGFTAHITLAYVKEPPAVQPPPVIEFEVNDIGLGYMGKVYKQAILPRGQFVSAIQSTGIPVADTLKTPFAQLQQLMDEPILSSREATERATDFPKKGDDSAISLRNSQYPQFDRAYAERIKEQYPAIWRAGGNIRGNEAFNLWGRAREGDDSPAVLSWIKEREAWSARHYRDGMQLKGSNTPRNLSSIAGVVALMKWGTIGELGESSMKEIINEVADKLDADKERAGQPAVGSKPETTEGMFTRLLNWAAKSLKLTLRAIKDVDSWDGSASRWDSTADYCDDCLINLNTALGITDRDEWVQGNCRLPVREPGDSRSTYVRQAVYAAAARFNQMKKPVDVEQADWDRAVLSAARELSRAYEQMDMEPPSVLTDLTGRNRAMVEIEIEIKKGGGHGEEGEEYEEGVAMYDESYPMYEAVEAVWDGVETQVQEYGFASNRWYVLQGMKQENGQLIAYINYDGMLYEAPVMIQPDGAIVLGDMALIMPYWATEERAAEPIKKGITVTRAANGRYHYAMVSATSFLNRSGEIDSRALFDTLVAYAKRTGEYPVLDFYHKGDTVRLGQSYFTERVGCCLMELGWFDDTPIGRAFAEAVIADPEYWGASIAYIPTAEPVLDEVARDVFAIVYTSGIHKYTSLLPEADAANLFTGFAITPTEGKERNNMMTEKQMEAFLKGVAVMSPTERQAVLERINTVNRTADSGQLVFRQVDQASETNPAPAAPAPAVPAPASEVQRQEQATADVTQPVAPVPAEQAQPTVVVDLPDLEAQLQAILNEREAQLQAAFNAQAQEVERAFNEVTAQLTSLATDLQATMAKQAQELETLRSAVQPVVERQQVALQDAPANGTLAGYHVPRLNRAAGPQASAEEAQPASYAERAQKTLSKFKIPNFQARP